MMTEYEIDIDALYATYKSLLPMGEEDSARLWQKFRLDWNYNSNRIEGNTLTRGETKELLERGVKPVRMRKDILQMQSHDKAIDFLRDLARSDTPLTEADIRALHKIALGENYWTEAITADGTITRREIEIGVYKKRPNIVLKTDGSEHVYAAPQEVPARMEATIKRLRTYLKKPDVALHDYLAELHQDFIQTHPFDDGNGRVVRLLVNYVCLHLNWPPVIIKSDKRSEYIASLESWNDGNEKLFRDLMKSELIWSLNKSIAAARGEDIDDPDDLDKEIDLFLADKEGQFEAEHIEAEVNTFKLLRSFLSVDELISSRFARLQKVFLKYSDEANFSLSVEKLELTPEIMQKGLSKTYILDGWKSPLNDYKIDLKLELLGLKKKPFIKAKLSVWRNGVLSSGEGHLKSQNNVSFSDGDFRYDPYGFASTGLENADAFGNEIVKAVFEEIKLF